MNNGAALGHHFNRVGSAHRHRERPHLQHATRLVYAAPPQSKRGLEAGRPHTPASDDIPWCREPENAVTLEDVDFLMSSHFEGTPYDPYGTLGTPESRHRYRPIGINRTGHMVAMQIRPYAPAESRSIMWISYGSGPSPRPRRSMRTSTIRPPTCATPRRKSRPATCTGRTV